MKTGNLMRIGSLAVLTSLMLVFSQCDSTEQALPDTNTVVAARDNGNKTAGICACLAANFPNEALSQSEIDALMYMREEEKLARDVYLAMNDKWNVRVFANIANAEQRHMDAVKCLIDKYDLTDVVGTNPQGVFVNTELQSLYNTLIAEGSTSLVDAWTVGARIEDLDIYDLMTLLEDPEVDNADVTEVFNNLMRASRNHLRAFTRNLENLDVTYAPEYITPETYHAIVTGAWETGNGVCYFCMGNGGRPGNGNGPGNGQGVNCMGTGMGNGPGNGNGPGYGNGPGDGTGICPYGNQPDLQRTRIKRAGRNQ